MSVDYTDPAIMDRGALEDEVRQLRAMLTDVIRGRCEVCSWPYEDDDGAGCHPGDCSYRPEPHSDEYARLAPRRNVVKMLRERWVRLLREAS